MESENLIKLKAVPPPASENEVKIDEGIKEENDAGGGSGSGGGGSDLKSNVVSSSSSGAGVIPVIAEPRKPTTRKEIKFFGTEVFDEKNLIKKSPKKFLPRACSFGEKYYNSLEGSINRDGKSKRNNFISASSSSLSPSILTQQHQQKRRFADDNRDINGKFKNFEIKFLDVDDIQGGGGGGGGNDDDDDDEFDVNILCEGVNEKRKLFRKRTTSVCVDEVLQDAVSSSSQSSSATELISRRGVFSRRHYGSVDQFPQSDLEGLDQNCRRFRLENGESLAEKDEVFGSPSTPILENPEHQTRWYFKYFLGKLHQNYVGNDSEKNPYFLSIVSLDSGNKCMPLYRAMLFRKQGTQKIAIPYNPNQKLTVKQLLSHFPNMDTTKTPKEIFSADIQKDLLLLEEQEGSVNFKFGVVYMKSGQKVDDEMLSNECGSEDFEEFLGVLGEKIRLQGWERYRGGLDIKGNMTGKYSVYTLYEGHEIMFHVSTLLPFSQDNRQQVERKRHIGNDIVNIVYVEGSTAEDGCEFVPNCIKSQFTHIFAVVTKCGKTYRLSVYCDETVPPFGPTLPNPPEFDDLVAFREFLLVKLINGEKATFQTPTFSRKRERTLEMLIKDLYEEYVNDTKMTMLNRRAFSEVLYDAPRTSKLKEDARQVEFVRIGQALKLEAIVRGDAPTSLASAGPGSVFKRPPWEPQCFYPSFHHRGSNLVGDSFGHDSLFIATEEGTFLIKEDQSHRLIFDRTLSIKQLTVVEDHGILLIRGGSATSKDGYRIHVFRLNEFVDENIKIRSRIEVKDRRLEKTRGCHLYTIAKGSDGHLRMAVALGKKLQIFQWKHTAAWTSWCPNSDNDTVDGFLLLKEISLHDNPTIMTILETPINARVNAGIGIMVCIGFKHHFEIVSEQTGISTKLHEIESGKRSQTHLVAALDLCDGQETELLLCYNHTCHFHKLSDDCSKTNSEFDFHWNTSPTSIVCAFPYIIAFTSDSMEIRLLVNGNLVHIVQMAELQLLTSKRDIYFSTTAPEFISKDLRLKWAECENQQNSEKCTSQKAKMAELSNDKILEIKHKIEKIQENHNNNTIYCTNETVSNNLQLEKSDSLQQTTIASHKDNKMAPIDTLEVLNNLKPILAIADETPLQRVRSLQNHKDRRRDSDEIKKQMSKSNSYTDASQIQMGNENEYATKQIHEICVPPPNSPKLFPHQQSDSCNSTAASPSKNSKTRTPISRFSHDSSPDRQKPLRIYRIPLTNLTGAHHSHAHNPHSKKTQPNKIVEDSREGHSLADSCHQLRSSSESNAQDSDIVLLNNMCTDDKIHNCTNLSVISSSFS